MTAEQLKIRPYRPGDKPTLLTVFKRNVPDYFAETEVDELEKYLEHEIEQYFVVEIGDEIVGAGGINVDNHTIGKISWDFINPKYHGKGIGAALLNHRIALLKSTKGIEQIRVRTSQLAYRFYEKNGFFVETIVNDYWAPGFDLYDMRYGCCRLHSFKST
jgi:Acetyltransferases